MKGKVPQLLAVLLTAAVCCVIMAAVDGVIQPGYAVKSAIKLTVFGLAPIGISLLCKLKSPKEIFRFRKRGFLMALGLGVGLYALILGAFFIARPFFDFTQIAGSLTQNAGVTKENFLYVSLYISFVNSLLEEFFFRGFVFTNLKEISGRRFAYPFSALLFSVYHVAIMTGWFGLGLNTLILASLAVGGVIFNWLNEKQDCIYVSWLTHMFANFAINTIGFMLLNG